MAVNYNSSESSHDSRVSYLTGKLLADKAHNTAHSGAIATVHANSAIQGISRFTTCVLQSGVEIPYRAIKSNIAESLNIVLQIDRRPGLRIVSEVIEIANGEPTDLI